MKTRAALVALLCSIVPASFALAAHAPRHELSHNWAGYVADSGTYSGVAGSWTVPSVTPGKSLSASAAWIGVGGMASADLIQTGIRARSEGGTVSYEAWYELYPAPAVALPLTVAPGDTMHASLAEIARGTWRITLTDTTSGASYATTTAYASSGSSAEWVVEAPGTAGGTLLALDQFSPIAFSDAFATESGIEKSPAALGAAELSLVTQSVVRAAPTPLSAEGTSFTIVRK